jgi:hypothetical protein
MNDDSGIEEEMRISVFRKASSAAALPSFSSAFLYSGLTLIAFTSEEL